MTAETPALLGGPPVRPAGPPDWPPSDPALTAAVREALADGSWGKYHGPWCRRLQEVLAVSHGVEQVLLTSSGTAAVELALRGLGVAAGDEVIVAAYDFKGNFQDVLALGAVPVLVDVRPDDWMLDVEQVPRAISSRTRAIIASHLHGGQVDMPALCALASERGIGVLEDACQSPLAHVAGKVAGTWGDVGVLSFGGSKLVTAGRGGAVVTRRADVAQRIRLYVQRGNDAYPLSELQAAALLPQWERLADYNHRRAESVAWFGSSGRRESTEATAAPRAGDLSDGLVALSPRLPDSRSAYYKLGLQYSASRFGGLTRDQFSQAMRAEGIALDPGLRALHATHSSRRFRAVSSLAEAARADQAILTLHHPVLLGSTAALGEVVAAIEKVRQSSDALRDWFGRQSESRSPVAERE